MLIRKNNDCYHCGFQKMPDHWWCLLIFICYDHVTLSKILYFYFRILLMDEVYDF